MAMDSLKLVTKSIFAVFWFVLLFVVAILVAAVTLSASQFQSRLTTLSNAGVPVTVWQIERIRQRLNLQQERIEQEETKVETLRQQTAKADVEFQTSQAKFTMSGTQFQRSRNEVVGRIRLYDPLFVDDDFALMEDEALHAKIEQAMEGLRGKLRVETQKLIDSLYAAYLGASKNMDDASLAFRAADNAILSAKMSLEREQAALETLQKGLELILNPDNRLEPADVTRLSDLMSEFDFIQRFAFGALYQFSTLPSDFLIIVLVITMGVLGSTLQLTYDYYRAGGVRQTSLFFLRPMLGAITALVVFVLLKAGVLIVTDSAKLGEVAPLNPFFIAFVGIVSGLLSENALETIRTVGQTWLRGSDSASAARWAVGLKGTLPEGKVIADLSTKTGIDAGDLEEWIGEKAPVPPDAQKVIAAWLDRDVRSLFTDRSPPPQTAS